EQLVNALHTLGVDFIMGGSNENASMSQSPAQMIAALAKHNEARLRLSLIPLFLEHPEFSKQAQETAKSLPEKARLFLQCYYSASVWLQKIHHTKLSKLTGKKALLPDLFSFELGIPVTENPETNLRLLAEQHQKLSGEKVNWLGTYKHAAQVFINGLELKHRG
ncbi:MAG TPA: hypothetical protein PKC52_17520, partial [Anaerolineales bacterium]|nr:hypothetical protein [Anaerolineales bacterium]